MEISNYFFFALYYHISISDLLLPYTTHTERRAIKNRIFILWKRKSEGEITQELFARRVGRVLMMLYTLQFPIYIIRYMCTAWVLNNIRKISLFGKHLAQNGCKASTRKSMTTGERKEGTSGK